ncbi:MAG: hypothetical protein CL843_00005 [Crocinitomicaceae bacterium]|nr:hypothetical protein [Crocinitomicaceae bacterium]|tara:strand:- start:219 stop:2633 length:2415 start_codon:yes stop_codon:yes gene_type:complete
MKNFKLYFIKVIALMLLFSCSNTKEEEEEENFVPGTDIAGYGYNIFGEYARMSSRKDYCLFDLKDMKKIRIGKDEYDIPKYLNIKNISQHDIKTVEGDSKRDYAMSLSAKVGFTFEAMVFSGSVEGSYDFESSESEHYYYYTVMDAIDKWQVSIETRDLEGLKAFLEPQFKKDLENMDPYELFDHYGTHYISSAFIGGRIDYTSESKVSEGTTTQAIAAAVNASYGNFTGDTEMETSDSQTLKNAETKTKLSTIGGNSEFLKSTDDSDNYSKWVEGISEKPVLCDFPKGGLRPIWEFASAARQKELNEAFDELCKKHPLPQEIMTEMAIESGDEVFKDLFYIQSVSESTYWDLAGTHYNANKIDGKVKLFHGNGDELTGADRFYKIIPSGDAKNVYIQPQHTKAYVTTASNSSGSAITLKANNAQNNPNQKFKKIAVEGTKNTYYLQSATTGFYLTAKGSNIALEKKSNSKNQQWLFKPADSKKMAAPFEGKYLLKNVAGNVFYANLPGNAPENQKDNGNWVVIKKRDDGSDYTLELKNVSNSKKQFFIQPMHSPKVFDFDGNGLTISDQHGGDNQKFEFIYAGSPMVFLVRCVKDDKYLQLEPSETTRNDSWIKLKDANLENAPEYAKWELEPVVNNYVPDPNQEFYIRSAYSDKFIDLPGTPQENNAQNIKALLYDIDHGKDQIYKFKPAGDGYLYVVNQNGNRKMIVANDGNFHTSTPDFNGDNSKFLLKIIAPYEFVLVAKSNPNKALEVGPVDNSLGSWFSGSAGHPLYFRNLNYNPSQRFVLVHANGSNALHSAKIFD